MMEKRMKENVKKENYILYDSHQDYFVLKLVGDMRFSIASSLETALQSLRDLMENKRVIVDISDLSYADSTVLGVLTGYFIREEDEKALRIHAPIMVCQDSDFKKILSNIGFDQYFDFKKEDERCKKSINEYAKILL